MELTANEIEAANRAEVTALLIRCGYRVYRPEADVHGEDLILRRPDGALLPTQLKGRLYVDGERYGRGEPAVWMLFPECPHKHGDRREWFLVPHNTLFDWLEKRHGHTASWPQWGTRSISVEQRQFLESYRVVAPVHMQSSVSGSGKPRRQGRG